MCYVTVFYSNICSCPKLDTPQDFWVFRTYEWRLTELRPTYLLTSTSVSIVWLSTNNSKLENLFGALTVWDCISLFLWCDLPMSGALKGSFVAVLLCLPPASSLFSTTRLGPLSWGQSTASFTLPLLSCSKRSSWWMMPVLQVCKF